MDEHMNPAIEGRSAEILARTPKGGTVVELGVWNGRLSVVLLERGDMTLHMVDSWAPRAERPERYLATVDPVARSSDEDMANSRLAAFVLADTYPARCVIHESDTADAAADFDDATVDVVFIDADHSEEGVARDIEAWLPKVRSGGWLGGHDFQHPSTPGVEAAVRKAFGKNVEVGRDRTWWVQV